MERQQIQHKPLAPRSAPLPAAAQYSPHYAQQTPVIFQSVNLRRGKWTKEEEDYAEFVIQQFEKGTLRECENGTTLRAFLSRKLHCAPMRISKKYAGKSIGKLVFVSKTNTPETTLAEVETKRRELEVKFYQSLYEEMRDGPRPPIGVNGYVPRYVPSAQQMMVPSMPMAPHAVGTYMPQPVVLSSNGTTISQPVQHHQHQHMMQLASTSQPLQQQRVIMPPTSHPNSVCAPTHNQPVVLPPHVVSQPSSMTPTAQAPLPSATHTQQLEQSYLNAVNQMMANGHPLMPSTNAVANNDHAMVTAQMPVVPFDLPGPMPNHTSVGQASTTDAAASLQQKPPPAQHGVKQRSNSVELPDFLSGFEKVGVEHERPPWMMPGALLFGGFQGSGVCSPPLTSKSFDDLHQLLGEAGTDLYSKPLDLNAGSSENGSSEKQHQQKNASHPMPMTQQQHVVQNNIATDQLQHSADIYATFAQQSALAVSQHSAYCRGDKASPDGNGIHIVPPTAASLDLSASLAAMYGGQHASVVSQANLRAHSLSTQQQIPQAVASLKGKPQTSFAAPPRNVVSGSERSSDVGSNEDGGSMHGSTTSSNNGTSDTTSNDSDSASDDGPPPQKRTKTGGDHVYSDAREAVSPVSFDRCSPRSQ